MSRRNAWLSVLTLPVLALSACGGGGDSDKDKLTKIIKDGNSKPATVCDHLAADLLKQIGGKAGCQKAAAAEKPDNSTDIQSLKVTGDTALAKVKDNDGANTINFVKEDGEWKVTVTQ